MMQNDNMNSSNYDKLNELGYITGETVINDGDVIIGKVELIQPSIYKDRSEIYKSFNKINTVVNIEINNDRYEIIKCKIKSTRSPIIGDMYCTPVNLPHQNRIKLLNDL